MSLIDFRKRAVTKGCTGMIKLMIFDLDGTLAELGQGVRIEDIEILKELEGQGVTIAICSGKPTYYLCGFMRQVGLKEPVLIGENGAVIQFGVQLPPEKYYILPYSDEAKQTLSFLKNQIMQKLPDIWYQPNEVGLTPFPRNEAEFEIIEELLKEKSECVKDVDIYRHVDSYDIAPKGLDKKAGLKYLGELLNISHGEMIAIGDGVNDYPMFEYAGYSVGVNVKEDKRVDRNFETLAEALQYLRGVN